MSLESGSNVTADMFLLKAVEEMQDRASQRDSEETGERSMASTVAAFNQIYHKDLTEEQGWAFMVLLKLVRSSQGAYRSDDYVDGAAYFGLTGEAAAKTTPASKFKKFEAEASKPGFDDRSLFLGPKEEETEEVKKSSPTIREVNLWDKQKLVDYIQQVILQDKTSIESYAVLIDNKFIPILNAPDAYLKRYINKYHQGHSISSFLFLYIPTKNPSGEDRPKWPLQQDHWERFTTGELRNYIVNYVCPSEHSNKELGMVIDGTLVRLNQVSNQDLISELVSYTHTGRPHKLRVIPTKQT